MTSSNSTRTPVAQTTQPDNSAAQATDIGIVKWFDIRKGYGFIVDSQGRDILVHYSAICEPGFRLLRHNQNVRFTANQGAKGLYATDVVCLDRQPERTMDD